MATTVSTAKPATPYNAAAASAAGGKVKKPAATQQQPQPSVGESNAQNGVNGVKAQSQSSAVSKPSGSKQTPNGTGAVNGVNGKNAAGAKKKEAQKNLDSVVKLLRPTGRTGEGEHRGKIPPEPCVKTTGYILRKYKGCPPSFTIHLHPTHFRFDNQDGSFSYNSEMKFIIAHIKAGTVPHDMVEELIKGGVRFYEGCLIVRVVDHKTASARSDTKPASGEKLVPFSLHNYNSHITPSPYAPFPKQVQNQSKSNAVTNSAGNKSSEQTQASGSADQAESKEKEKPVVNGNVDAKPRVFTTVLHPTPLSMQAEITLCALTPDPRAPKKPRPSQANASSSSSDRPAKRQKMMVEPDELPEFEAKLIRATAPPLYLEPVEDIEACQKLLDMLQSPLHCNKPPSPKVRRRTVAELAADEAAAAEEQRFMLIMDERLELAASSSAGGPKSTVDDEGGAAPFEPRFSRFKTLENIRAQHEEKAKREHERKLQQDQLKRQQQDAEREKRRILEARQATEAAREEARKQFLAQQQAQQQQAQQALQNQHAQAQAQAAQAQMAARRPPSQGSVAGFPQQMVSTQGPQSSPIVRNATPHAGSPLAANMMGTQPGQMGTVMGMTTQGAGSPLQVSAGLQHGHPGVMPHPMVASRSQQGQSAHGTPQMAHGTPSMAHSTPIMSQATPQRMTHASPSGSATAPTPVMNNHGLAMVNGNGMLTPQQQQALMARQLQLAQQGLGGHQFSPQQLAQLHAQQSIQQQRQQQQHAGMQFPNQQQAYQQQILRSQLAQMQMSQQGQLSQQQMLAAANQQVNGMGQPRPRPAPSPYHALYSNHVQRLRKEWINQHLTLYGDNPQLFPQEIRKEYFEVTDNMAKRIVTDLMRKDREEGNPRAQQYEQLQAQLRAQQRLQQAQAQAQAQALQQQQQQMMNGMVNGMGK